MTKLPKPLTKLHVVRWCRCKTKAANIHAPITRVHVYRAFGNEHVVKAYTKRDRQQGYRDEVVPNYWWAEVEVFVPYPESDAEAEAESDSEAESEPRTEFDSESEQDSASASDSEAESDF